MSSVEDQLALRFNKMRDAFKALDLDRSGTLSRDELRRALQMWNLSTKTEETIDLLMAACDKDGSGDIDYKEFIDVLARDSVAGKAIAVAAVEQAVPRRQRPGSPRSQSRPRTPIHPTMLKPAAGAIINEKNAILSTEAAVNSRFKNMHQAFQSIDMDHSGTISREEMRDALQKWNIPITGVLDVLMTACDRDGNGGIDYKECAAQPPALSASPSPVPATSGFGRFVEVLARDKHAGSETYDFVS